MLCHVWPGFTPMNVRQMSWSDWQIFAAQCDDWLEARRGHV